jgi:hypothetical protein
MNIEKKKPFAKRQTNDFLYIYSTKVFFPPRVCPLDVSRTSWQEVDVKRLVNSWEKQGLVC